MNANPSLAEIAFIVLAMAFLIGAALAGLTETPEYPLNATRIGLAHTFGLLGIGAAVLSIAVKR